MQILSRFFGLNRTGHHIAFGGIAGWSACWESASPDSHTYAAFINWEVQKSVPLVKVSDYSTGLRSVVMGDLSHAAVILFALLMSAGLSNDCECAVKLYDAVRDGVHGLPR